MSMHPTLRTGSKIKAKRNVLKRYERVDILKKRRKHKDEDSVYGLPKTQLED
jgi:small basic protein (TIGR04137 family)